MPQHNDGSPASNTESIQVIEESASISAQPVETGRVRVQLRSEVEQHQLQATLRSEAVTIERRAIGRQLAEGEPLPVPHEEEDGRVTVIPVLEEILVVEKRLVLREELRLRRSIRLEEVEQPIDVLRQHAEVTRHPPAGHRSPETEPAAMRSAMSTQANTQTITAVFDSMNEAETAAQTLAMQVGGVRAALYGSEADATRLRDVGVSAPDRDVLEEAIRRGGAVLSATVPEDRIARVTEVLESSGAVDLDEREANWRQSGWQGSGATATKVNAMDTGTAGMGTAGMGTTATGIGAGTAATGTSATGTSATGGTVRDGQDEVIPVVEEHLRVGKREAATGRIRVHSHIVETPVEEQVTLHQEHVQVERRPVDRPVDATAAAFQDRTIEATETTEEAVVAKEARVVEEVVLRKTSDDETRFVRDTVRHTEVSVDDDRVAGTARGTSTSTGTTAQPQAPKR